MIPSVLNFIATLLIAQVVPIVDISFQEPTQENLDEVAEILESYEIDGLRMDRYAVIADGTLAAKSRSRSGQGTAILSEVHFLLAEDVENGRRRIKSSKEDVFVEGYQEKQLLERGGFAAPGSDALDILLELRGKKRMWCWQFGGVLASGESSVDEKAKIMSTLNRRPVFNPRAAAFGSVNEHRSATYLNDQIRLSMSRVTGFAKSQGRVYVRWFFPVRSEPGKPAPNFGINRYIVFADGLPTIVEDRTGPRQDSEDSAEFSPLYSRSLTTWSVIDGFKLPIKIRSQSGPKVGAHFDFECDFAWKINDAVAKHMFTPDSSQVSSVDEGSNQ